MKRLTERYTEKLYWLMFDAMEGNIKEYEFRDRARILLCMFLSEMWCESSLKFLKELEE